eukprot:s4719_g8.t1
MFSCQNVSAPVPDLCHFDRQTLVGFVHLLPSHTMASDHPEPSNPDGVHNQGEKGKGKVADFVKGVSKGKAGKAKGDFYSKGKMTKGDASFFMQKGKCSKGDFYLEKGKGKQGDTDTEKGKGKKGDDLEKGKSTQRRLRDTEKGKSTKGDFVMEKGNGKKGDAHMGKTDFTENANGKAGDMEKGMTVEKDKGKKGDLEKGRSTKGDFVMEKGKGKKGDVEMGKSTNGDINMKGKGKIRGDVDMEDVEEKGKGKRDDMEKGKSTKGDISMEKGKGKKGDTEKGKCTHVMEKGKGKKGDMEKGKTNLTVEKGKGKKGKVKKVKMLTDADAERIKASYSLRPRLIQKWQSCHTSKAKFEFLRAFMLDPQNMSSITIESEFAEASQRDDTSQWSELPLCELRKQFTSDAEKRFLETGIVGKQTGRRHPQDHDDTNPELRLYWVFRESTDATRNRQSITNRGTARGEVPRNRAATAAVADGVLARAADFTSKGVGKGHHEEPTVIGKGKGKGNRKGGPPKAKKVKSAEEIRKKDFDDKLQKFLS